MSTASMGLTVFNEVSAKEWLTKLNFTLIKLYQSYQTYLENEKTEEAFSSDIPLLTVERDRVAVELIPEATIAQLVSDLSPYNFTLESNSDRALIGDLPIPQLPEIAQLESLTFARPHYQPVNNIESPVNTYLENSFPAKTAASKLSFHLTHLYQAAQNHGNNLASRFPFLRIEEEEVTVELVAENSPSELLTDLTSLEFTHQSSFGQMVTGEIAIDQLPSLSEINSLHTASPVYQPIANVGSTTSQADTSINADLARDLFDVSGEGVTIGVLSDSFNNLGGASSDIASGDLPDDINVLQDLPRGGSDEGRAMLQLIHDLAPDADLAFRTAFGGKTDFAQGILELAEAGADIIVDDVVYFNEPFFQDGVVAQAVDEVVSEGVSFFSSAGNSGRKSYESEFRPSGEIFDLGSFQLEAHDFNPTSEVDLFQEIRVPEGGQVSFSFQWDEPFFSAENDIDIFLLNEEKTDILAGSLDANVGNNPVEIFSFTNDGSFDSNEFNLAIGKTLESDHPEVMKYVGFGDLSINEFATNSSTLFGHANATEANAVGAAFFEDTPAFGTTPPEIESFSALGGTPILFDEEGNRLAEPEIRQKPDIVAPDGTNTTFFGNDIASDADSDPNFFGTSAAAPHAAAAAGLLKDADPSLTPSEISTALETTALDMDDPATPEFDTGFDPVTGHGLIQVDQALRELAETRETSATENLTLDVDGNGEADALTDGVLIMRYLLGFRGNDLLEDVVASDATRETATEIEGYLAEAESQILDVDGNEEVDALTDGTVTLRFLFGMRDEGLVEDVIGEGATRTTDEEISSYLEEFLPPV
ncbi:MAG: S8 family peptidase [Halothece sp.]